MDFESDLEFFKKSGSTIRSWFKKESLVLYRKERTYACYKTSNLKF
jgi:hypothetical protein